MKKFSSILFVITLLSVTARAQFNLGIATGNWSGISALALNPANIAGAREKYSVSIFAVNAGVDNNVGTFNIKNGFVLAVGDGKSNNMFSYSNNSKVSAVAPYITVTGPGVMYRIDKKNTIAFTTALKGMNQFNNFDQSIFHSFNDSKFRSSETIDATSQKFNYTVHLWSEVGLSYATTLLDKGSNRLKMGVTLRYLGGIAYVGVKGRNMNAHFDAAKDTFSAKNTDLEYASNVLTTTGSGSNVNGNIAGLLFNGNAGNGFGGDIGAVYEYTPLAERKNGYLVRFSAAVMDLGSIYYRGSNNRVETFTGNGNVTGQGIIDNVKNFNDLQRYATQRGFTADIQKTSTTIYMPTRLMLGGDYRAYKSVYVNVTYLFNLANRQNYGNSFYNQFTVTPRYETRLFTAGLPLTYSTLSNSFKVGLGLQASALFLGFDDMLGLFSHSQAGVNFYAGVNLRLYK